MARRAVTDTTIGQRIHDRRKLLGWTIRYAADRAGISHTSWSRIERGLMSADNRFTLAAIAEALRCSVGELAGLPPDPVTRDEAETSGAVYETMRAAIEADLTVPPSTSTPHPPVEQLSAEAELILDLRTRCDYRGAVQRLPALIRGLYAAAGGRDRKQALRALVIAEDAASFVVRYMGHPAPSCLLAERAQQAAEVLDDPVMLALAAWGRIHAATNCGLYQRALTLANTAADGLSRHLNLPNATELLGMIHLTRAFALYALGQTNDALTPLQEAQKLAERTGDSDALSLWFGPTNIRFWQVAMEVDSGDPGKAVETARTTNPQVVPSISRQATFYIDTGRALARTGQDRDALRMLLAAERLAPQRMRDPLIAETARSMLERARRGAGWSELRGLCERVGVLD